MIDRLIIIRYRMNGNNKKFLFLAFVTVLLSYELNNIYVIEDFEVPWLYRFFYLIAKYVGLHVKHILF